MSIVSWTPFAALLSTITRGWKRKPDNPYKPPLDQWYTNFQAYNAAKEEYEKALSALEDSLSAAQRKMYIRLRLSSTDLMHKQNRLANRLSEEEFYE